MAEGLFSIVLGVSLAVALGYLFYLFVFEPKRIADRSATTSADDLVTLVVIIRDSKTNSQIQQFNGVLNVKEGILGFLLIQSVGKDILYKVGQGEYVEVYGVN